MTSTDGTYAKYFHFTFYKARLRTGWNFLKIAESEWNNVNADSWNDNIKRIRIKFQPETGKSIEASVGGHLGNVLPDCAIMMDFDDGSISEYENAYRLMQNKGLKGNVFVIGNAIGTSGKIDYYQLKNMYRSGWTIGNHSYSHVDLTTLTTQAAIADLKQCADILKANDIGNGEHIAYPYGYRNDELINAIKANGFKTARTADDYTINIPMANEDFEYILGCRVLNTSTTLASIKTEIDKLKLIGGIGILMLHGVKTSPSGGEWSNSDFDELLAYIVTNNIRVITRDEFYSIYMQ
jgi:peptidoglycan/xylan/chitin deacetylase (PgdA/CDA1 family)